MKSQIFSALCFITFTILFPGCDLIGSYERGNGNVITTSRNLETFNKISIGGNFEVTLKKSDKNILTITTDENLEPLIKSRVENGELEISSAKKLINVKKTKLIIGYNTINEIRVYGATLLNNEDPLESESISLNLEGAGVIDIQLKVDNLDARLSGAGMVKFNGYAANSTIRINGAGSLEAYGLETINSTIDVSGIGGAEINVKNKLTATIQGVGGIEYKGHPATVNKNVTGVGTIKEETETDDDSKN